MSLVLRIGCCLIGASMGRSFILLFKIRGSKRGTLYFENVVISVSKHNLFALMLRQVNYMLFIVQNVYSLYHFM